MRKDPRATVSQEEKQNEVERFFAKLTDSLQFNKRNSFLLEYISQEEIFRYLNLRVKYRELPKLMKDPKLVRKNIIDEDIIDLVGLYIGTNSLDSEPKRDLSLIFLEVKDSALTIIPWVDDDGTLNMCIEPLSNSPQVIQDLWYEARNKSMSNITFLSPSDLSTSD